MYLKWINFHLESCLSTGTGTSAIQVAIQQDLCFTVTLAKANDFLLLFQHSTSRPICFLFLDTFSRVLFNYWVLDLIIFQDVLSTGL